MKVYEELTGLENVW